MFSVSEYLLLAPLMVFFCISLSQANAMTQISKISQVNESADKNANTVIIKISKRDIVRKTRWGFNIELGLSANSGGVYDSKVIRRLVEDFHIEAIRFPGGTPANYFDWKTKRVSKRLVNKFGGNEHIERLIKRLEKVYGEVPRSSLSSFARLCKRYDLIPVVVVNLLDGIEQLHLVANEVRKAFPSRSVFLEMGNELSSPRYGGILKRYGKSPEAGYVNKLLEAISIVPRDLDKVGVVASEVAKARHPKDLRMKRIERERKEWDSKIRFVKGYDAVIYHPYIYAKRKTLSNLINKYKKTNSVDDNWIKYRWVLTQAYLLPKEYMNRASSRFPDKKIWITEMGIIEDRQNNRAERITYHSGSRALGMLAYSLNWLRYADKVELMLFHGLFVGYSLSAAVYPDMTLTANGVAYKLLGEFLYDCEKMSSLHIEGSPVIPGVGKKENISTVNGMACKTGMGVWRFLIVNLDGDKKRLKLPWKEYGASLFILHPDKKIEVGQYPLSGNLSLSKFRGSVFTMPGFSAVLIEKAYTDGV